MTVVDLISYFFFFFYMSRSKFISIYRTLPCFCTVTSIENIVTKCAKVSQRSGEGNKNIVYEFH